MIRRASESGNIFFALFGAVALVAVLGGSVMTFMKGPLATSVKITRINTAETQMSMAAQVSVMAAANTPTSGDCDADGLVEPLEWRDAGALPAPAGGGLIPMSIGVSKKDPWGTEYGYCVWDHGTNGACDDETGAGDNPAERLAGGPTGAGNIVVAIVSAGPDKTFTTTCRDFDTADVDDNLSLADAGDLPLVSKAAETDDDIIFAFTYDEATGASGGLWRLKSGEPGTATINKDVEVTGGANFSGMGEFQGGVLLPDSSLITCDATTAGVMARNASGGIDICDGAGAWDAISGGGGAATGFSTDNTVPCDATTIGQVRYNATTELPEYCDGTNWRPFTLASQVANLVLTPSQQNAMDVDGANNLDTTTCTGPWVCGTTYDFVLQNQGGAISALINVSLTGSYTSNFVIFANSCTIAGGNTDGKLDPMESCTITVKPKANGNMTYTTNLSITANNNPFAVVQGTAAGFGCTPGRVGGGGIYAACNQNDGDGAYDLIIMPGGCNGATVNPTCSGNDGGAVQRTWGSAINLAPSCNCDMANVCKAAKRAVDIIQAQTIGYGTFSAASYCDAMEYGGKTDWFLPNPYQLATLVYPNRVAIGGFSAGFYQTSSERNASEIAGVSPTSGGSSCGGSNSKETLFFVRCVRREDLPLPTATVDTNPDDLSSPFPMSVTTTSGGRTTSASATFTGYLQAVNVSVSGASGNPMIQVSNDGGSTWSAEATSGTLTSVNGRVRILMDAPTVAGTKYTATLEIGSGPDTYTWELGYADPAGEAIVFVTSGNYSGSLGGLSGADSTCQSLAASAGYSGTWTAILSSSVTPAISRLPFNWATLKRPDGALVANGWNDLWDGSIQNPINLTEAGLTKTTRPRTNTTSSGAVADSTYWQSCNDWTSSAGGGNSVIVGNPSSMTSAWVNDGGTGGEGCRGDNFPLPIYCLSANPGTDTKPSMPNATGDFTYAIQVPTSTLTTSNAVTVAGLGSGVSATVTITGASGSPGFTVNGIAGTSGVTTVQNGDSLELFMTSPATDNTSYSMTVTVGSGSAVTWRVWTTGDPTGTVVKRVFVTSTIQSGNFGGISGADAYCQSRAAAAGLGGSWKAILSGLAEPTWAINRVGYNWSFLKRVGDSATVATTGTLWSGTLTNAISKTEFGADLAASVATNTNSNGIATYSGTNQACKDWTGAGDYQGWDYSYGASGSLSGTWAVTSSGDGCGNGIRLYCIEQ